MTIDVRDTFEIVISGHQAPYTVNGRGPDVGPVISTLGSAADWLSDEAQAILKEMQTQASSSRDKEIQKVGEALYRALFTTEIKEAYLVARGNAKDRKLRLRLFIESPELAALPWEVMHNGKDWLAMSSESPLVRRLPGKTPSAPRDSRGSLRILFVGASPKAPELLEINLLDAEKRLVKALAKPVKQNKAQLYRMINPTLDELETELASEPGYHILLFLGHGVAADPNTQPKPQACIYLDGTSTEDLEDHPFILDENEQRGERKASTEASPITADVLAPKLEGKNIQMVFLAACYTAKAVSIQGDDYAGFAQGLAEQAPMIVAMQYFIGSDTGAQLAEAFLRELAASQPADIALVRARNALRDVPGLITRDLFSPVMYLQRPELETFDSVFPVNLLSDGTSSPSPKPYRKYAIIAGITLLALVMLGIGYRVLLSFINPPPISPEITTCLIINADSLNLRQYPGTVYQSLGTVSRGQQVQLVAYSSSAHNRDEGLVQRPWVQIQSAGLAGWINRQFVDCPPDLDFSRLPQATPPPLSTSVAILPKSTITPALTSASTTTPTPTSTPTPFQQYSSLLDLDADTTLGRPDSVVILPDNIITNGHALEILGKTLRSRSGVTTIVSFPVPVPNTASAGTPGASGADTIESGAVGTAGLPGEPGAPGNQGQSAGSITISADKIETDLKIDNFGQQGGDGGNGGRGGDGGNGQKGTPAEDGLFDCRRGPGRGGRGGDAGSGGDGGPGGNGGNGGDVTIRVIENSAEILVQTLGGPPGNSGLPGEPGAPGAGGAAGDLAGRPRCQLAFANTDVKEERRGADGQKASAGRPAPVGMQGQPGIIRARVSNQYFEDKDGRASFR